MDQPSLPLPEAPLAPREIGTKPKAYAFERSLGLTPAEACRRAGGKVENGHATKWERSPRVQAWIAYYRKLGNTDEMLAEKRRRIEERLQLAAFGNIFEFAEMVDREVMVKVGEGEAVTFVPRIVKTPLIDWDKVAASPYAAIIESFKFDKDTGALVDFERENALQALAQLRDMHGFKAVTKTALTDPSGTKPATVFVLSDRPMSETEWEAQHASDGV
ncbi:hypothetical protein ACRAVF_27155 [Bradyrhizobium oligotrophicum S58]